jgi:NTP pyrophosphatase (non-canonical NTP hydrolase)
MEINTYQGKAARTLAKIDGNILEDLHMVLGMQTEVAEIADVYKKNIAYKKPIDYVNIKEELGDAMWYIANLCNMHGWDLRDILDTNIAKLEARYPEKFTEEQALNRNLSAERKILETIPAISGGVLTTDNNSFNLKNMSHT